MGKDQLELFDSCREGDIGKVEALLCSRNRRPRTPLSFLKSNCSWLSTCRDPSTGYTALHISALNGHPSVVRALLSYHSQNYEPVTLFSIRDRRGCLPLHLASWNGHLETVVVLLDADVSCTTVNVLNNAKEAPLHLAAQHGHSRVACELLKRHADPTCRNARGETALDLAARFGRTTVARLLITHCPALVLSAAAETPPLRTPVSSYPGTPMGQNSVSGTPCSPLHLAARNGHLEIVKVLLDAGFDIDWITEEGSALHVSALFGKTPVVRYLLDRGISVYSRDWQGRTVLEVLEEHQGQRSMDLTQLMQNKDAWQECFQLITERLTHGTKNGIPTGKTLESMVSIVPLNKKRRQPSTVQEKVKGPASVKSENSPTSTTQRYENLNEDESLRARNKSPVWQRVPEVSPTSTHHSPKREMEMSGTRSKSALAEETRFQMEGTGERYRPLSVQALILKMENREESEDIASTISLTTSIQDPCSVSPSAASTVSSTGTFITTEEFLPDKAITLSHPVKPPRKNRKPPSTKLGSCPYQAPCGYETWATPDGAPKPMFGYDNIPSNMLVYDNAPAPGHKRWEHECDNPRDHHSEISSKDVQCTKQLSSQFGLSVKMNNKGVWVKSDQSIIDETIELIQKSCSDIEDSLSVAESQEIPPRSPVRVKFADNKEDLEDVKAPLALPETTEDLGGSTTEGEVLDGSSSGERTPGTVLVCEITEDTIPRIDDENPNEPPPSAWASESKIYEKIYPLGEELRRYSSASGGPPSPSESPSNKEQETQADGTSDSSGVCSENCSCGDGQSRQISPEKPVGYIPENAIPKKVQLRYANRMGSKTVPVGSNGSPLDESAEWQKINDIMASFGGGICRESVFSERYEPRVAVFLKNRQSSALTLTMGNSEARNSIAMMSPNSGLTPVARWLKSVGLEAWEEIARILETRGFERLEFLKECLSHEALSVYLKIKDPSVCDLIMDSTVDLPEFPAKSRLAVNKYVSDWLLSLGCQDYLGLFMKGGLDSIPKIRIQKWDMDTLRQLGIESPGHRCRILASLFPETSVETPHSLDSNSDLWSSTGIYMSDFEDTGALLTSVDGFSNSGTMPIGDEPNRRINATKEKSFIQESTDNRNCETDSEYVWKHDSSELVHGSIGYSAHYLGSTLVHVDNLEQSVAPIEAISKLKKRVREIAKIPQITMDISFRGVQLSDAVTKNKIGDHEIDHIRCVRQDERDLNCFAYITKDGERHFCHVFSVLTADVATEIILSLGQAFEVAYQLAKKHR